MSLFGEGHARSQGLGTLAESAVAFGRDEVINQSYRASIRGEGSLHVHFVVVVVSCARVAILQLFSVPVLALLFSRSRNLSAERQ